MHVVYHSVNYWKNYYLWLAVMFGKYLTSKIWKKLKECDIFEINRANLYSVISFELQMISNLSPTVISVRGMCPGFPPHAGSCIYDTVRVCACFEKESFVSITLDPARLLTICVLNIDLVFLVIRFYRLNALWKCFF